MQSDRLREEGNAFYKAGKLVEAIEKYKEAAKLAPRDSVPVRNLSAALYEVGVYKQCIIKAEEALGLVQSKGGDDEAGQVQKLKTRISKARAHADVVNNEELCKRRLKILRTVNRYRPSMFSSTEYYTVGHDTAQSLFSKHFHDAIPNAKVASFLFGGIGDARHLYATLGNIHLQEVGGVVPTKRYHLTINDINIYALARNLIVMMFLKELAEIKTATDGLQEETSILNAVFFTYLSPLMPPYAFERLHRTIDKALGALESRSQPIPWLFLHEKDFPSLAEALRSWKGRALNLFNTQQCVERITNEMKKRRQLQPDFISMAPPALKKEKLLYIHAAMLQPSKVVMQVHDPTLLNLLAKHYQQPKANADIFKRHLQDHWKVNTTLIDPSWYDELSRKEEYDFYNDPFEFASPLHVPDSKDLPGELYGYVSGFFSMTAAAVHHLGDRFTIEMIHDDFANVCEKMRHVLYRAGDNPYGGIENREVRPMSFPIRYDAIHMSNVPDYWGGHLSTFLYAMPILKKESYGIAISNCLRNPTMWNSMEDFLAEYQFITDDDMLNQLTNVTIVYKGEPPIPLGDYTAYMCTSNKNALAQIDHRHKFPDLLPRRPFHKWFYGLFFRLALPFNCEISAFMTVIYSPLNLTILFRLIHQLRILGYPSHWLHEALLNILQNQVQTTARPPRKLPMRPADVAREHPEKKLCTAPFVHEMKTLTRIFRPQIGFSLLEHILPAERSIFKYYFRDLDYADFQPQINCLVLLLWDDEMLEATGDAFMDDLRAVLDPSWGDEVNSQFKGERFEKFRERGVVMWSSASWDKKTRVATAWMPEEVVNTAGKKGWFCGLWRSDIWAPAFAIPSSVREVVQKGERWVDV